MALVATVGTYLWGLVVIVPAIRATDAAPLAQDGAARVVLLELLGFMVIFTCMILMRFGL